MMAETLRGIFCSESPLCSTGYGTVMYYLLPELSKLGYDVHMVGWQHNGRPLALPGLGIRFMYAHGLQKFTEPDFPERLPALMKGLKPDFVMSLIDIFHTQGLTRQTEKAGVPYINYFPVDSDTFWLGWFEHLEHSTRALTLSKFGKEIVEDWTHAFGDRKWCKDYEIDYVYHGVNTNLFKPLGEDVRNKLRAKVSLKRDLKDPYYILFVGRNIQRKQVPRLLRAFKKCHDKIPDARLILKIGNPKDSQGYYLPEYILRYGLQGKVAFADESTNPLEGVEEHKMAQWYNIAHVHASATSGEGFGLTTLEAMACGTPNIITDFSTSEELIGRGKEAKGWLIPVRDYADGAYNCRRALVDEDYLAAAMIEAWEKPDLREKYAKRGVEFAQKFTWADIAKRIDKVIKETV